jgi:hypothetical protein
MMRPEMQRWHGTRHPQAHERTERLRPHLTAASELSRLSDYSSDLSANTLDIRPDCQHNHMLGVSIPCSSIDSST